MSLVGDPTYDSDTSWVRKSEELEDIDMAGFITFLIVIENLAPTSATT